MIESIAFVIYPVSNIEISRRFYEDVLGLKLTHEAMGEWFEYDLGHATFAIATAVLLSVKNWRQIVLGVVAVVVGVGGVLWQAMRTREPVYQGKTLSAWLEQYSGNGGPVPREATEAARSGAATAIRQIGTNAIPHLLRMASAEDSPVKKWLLHFTPPQQVAARLLAQPTFFRWATKSTIGPISAGNGLRLLGAEAKGAVPGLIHIIRRGKNSMARLSAVLPLGAMGPAAENAIPALIENLNDPLSKVVLVVL